MAQINLLKQSSRSYAGWEIIPSVLVKLSALGLVALLAYYGWIFFQTRKAGEELLQTQEQIAQQRNEVINTKDRNELLTRQAQLKELDNLINNHVYWSQLLPEIARVTLKKATYSTIRAMNDGSVNLSVEVPSLADLDKYLQVFDEPRFNENFSDVQIGSLHKSQGLDNDKVTMKFDVRMKFNPAVLRYFGSTSEKK